MTKKTNIMFFFADDQRFDAIAALGNPEIHTPNLDALVERGVTFTHAHIPGGTSEAVCMPSRAMLNTGRSLFHIQDSGSEIPPEHVTIGEVFRQAGYRTFGTGKWHNGTASFQRSFTDGDEIMFGGMADHWNVPVYHYDPNGRYEQTRPEIVDPRLENHIRLRHCDHISAGLHSSQMVCDAAIRFIEELGDNEAFYAYVSFLAPHDPRSMPKEFLDMYDPAKISLPKNFMGGHPYNTGALHIRDEMLAPFPRDPDDTCRQIAEYYAMISHLDHELGRVVDTLKNSGLLDNTIIVFSADNGLALGQHGLFGKQNCYEHSVRVPLLFAGPGIPCGERRDSRVYLFDVFPTLCELCGLSIPESVDGCGLRTAIDNPGVAVRDALYFAYAEFQRAVKHGDFKLVEYVIEGRRHATQLFNLAEDSWELNNLAASPAHTSILENMRQILFRLGDEWGDLESPWGKTFWQGYGTR